MTDYIILRDLQASARGTQPSTSEPFGWTARGAAFESPPEGAPEPRIDIERLDARDVQDLTLDHTVQAVAPVGMPTKLIEPIGAPAPAAAGDAWGIATVGAHDSSYTGDGVVVAVLDTGIDRDHPAFAGIEIVERDFTGLGNGDVVGHGSHCAGTIFGRDVDGDRIGVARGVKKALIGKVLPDDGAGTSEMVIRAINWAVEEGADVVSMSLGWDFPGRVAELVDDDWPVEAATSAALVHYRATAGLFDATMNLVRKRADAGSGAVVVAAAGNESERDKDPPYEIAATLPAAAEGVISVGAFASDGARLSVTSFSNVYPQLAAPGFAIKSVLRGGGTCELNGTSMACPHVAGVAALWWESVRNSPQPHTSATVQAKLLALSRTDVFAGGLDATQFGMGLVTAP